MLAEVFQLVERCRSFSFDDIEGERYCSFSIPYQTEILERRLIELALKETGGNQTEAAKILEITRQGLHNKVKRYNLKIQQEVTVK